MKCREFACPFPFIGSVASFRLALISIFLRHSAMMSCLYYVRFHRASFQLKPQISARYPKNLANHIAYSSEMICKLHFSLILSCSIVSCTSCSRSPKMSYKPKVSPLHCALLESVKCHKNSCAAQGVRTGKCRSTV